MKKIILALILFVSLLFAKIETYTREYTYYAGDEDSKNSSRAVALVQVKKLLLEEVGTYIESHSLVENNMLTKDEIIAICAGITKTEILKEDWNGKTYAMQAKIQLDSEDVQKRLNKIAQDHDQSKTIELTEQYAKVQAALLENERLKKVLKTIIGEKEREKISADYMTNTQILSAAEWFDSGNEVAEYNDEIAIENYKKAIDINPNYAAAYYQIGIAYYRLVEYEAAIINFQKVIEIDPINYLDAYSCIWDICSDMGDYDTAIKNLQIAIDVNPNYSYAYNMIGTAHRRKADYDSAIKYFQKAIDIDLNNACAYSNIGVVLYEKADYNLAIINFQKAIDINPNYDRAYYNMGLSYQKKGDYYTAFKNYKKAIDINGAIETQSHPGLDYTYGTFDSTFNYFKEAAQLGDENAQQVCNDIDISW